ncbi:hypothetical protein PR202_gb08804 [Eleusine coracana subsp. coracana]|uniref:CBS domain-containing protein n=1 Tax=Eleusine coracana subsp. coracana TaxID=191504 RepID=A0AAV5EFU7_ELECO|nr:hypothetical protein PR202_gb08804 [Eleusine coracana subsp. coracana]
MTVSVCVILLELTNDLAMLPLVMLVLLISKTIADNFNKGVYDQIVGVEKVENIVHALRLTGHNGFPVVDEPPITESPELVGLVTRSHLLVLLQSKNFMKGQVKTSGSFVLRRFGAFDFAKPGSGKGLKIEDLDFADEEMDILMMDISLHCWLQRPPIVGILTRHDFMLEHVHSLFPDLNPHKFYSASMAG